MLVFCEVLIKGPAINKNFQKAGTNGVRNEFFLWANVQFAEGSAAHVFLTDKDLIQGQYVQCNFQFNQYRNNFWVICVQMIVKPTSGLSYSISIQGSIWLSLE